MFYLVKLSFVPTNHILHLPHTQPPLLPMSIPITWRQTITTTWSLPMHERSLTIIC